MKPKVKTKKYYRGNNLIGLKPHVGVVMDEGLLEAQRYASTRHARGESAPPLPSTPRELLARCDDVDFEKISKGKS